MREPTTRNAANMMLGIPGTEVARSLVWRVNLDIVDMHTGHNRFVVHDDYFNYRGLGETAEAALLDFFRRNHFDFSDGSGLYLPGGYGRESPESLTEKLWHGAYDVADAPPPPPADSNLPTLE